MKLKQIEKAKSLKELQKEFGKKWFIRSEIPSKEFIELLKDVSNALEKAFQEGKKEGKVIEFAIDVVEQYGYLDRRGLYYTDGGFSTLEEAFMILWKNKVIKSQDRVRVSEIKRYIKSKQP